jgi:hypothetical protein
MLAPREGPNLTMHGPAVDAIEYEALTSGLTPVQNRPALDRKNWQFIRVLFKFAVTLGAMDGALSQADADIRDIAGNAQVERHNQA